MARPPKGEDRPDRPRTPRPATRPRPGGNAGAFAKRAAGGGFVGRPGRGAADEAAADRRPERPRGNRAAESGGDRESTRRPAGPPRRVADAAGPPAAEAAPRTARPSGREVPAGKSFGRDRRGLDGPRRGGAEERAAQPRPGGRPRPTREDDGAERRPPARPLARPAAEPAPEPVRARPEDRPAPGTLWLHGLHAVAAALLNPRRRPRRLLLTAEAEESLRERLPAEALRRVAAERVESRARFHTFLAEDAVHQGAALLAHALPPASLEEALAASPGPVLLLDQVTDPRNVGAILRSAAAFGAAAVVMQDRHAPPETGALARAASGALESVPVVREVNLSRVIRALQEAGCWVVGLAGEAETTLQAAAGAGRGGRRAAIVLGAEESGMRRLQRENCDVLAKLPIAPGTESLNVAAAAAVALYELGRSES